MSKFKDLPWLFTQWTKGSWSSVADSPALVGACIGDNESTCFSHTDNSFSLPILPPIHLSLLLPFHSLSLNYFPSVPHQINSCFGSQLNHLFLREAFLDSWWCQTSLLDPLSTIYWYIVFTHLPQLIWEVNWLIAH